MPLRLLRLYRLARASCCDEWIIETISGVRLIAAECSTEFYAINTTKRVDAERTFKCLAIL
jgi:hypothetical protein